jgi:putative spermidine/putrescine transport system substrate-binding protein
LTQSGVLQSTSLCILAPNLLVTAVRFLNGAVDPSTSQPAAVSITAPPAKASTPASSTRRAAQLPSASNAAKQVMSYAWWSSPAGEAAEKRWVGFMQK